MLLKVVAVQARMGRPLSLGEKMHIFKQRADFVCLPEYWLLDESTPDYHRAALRWLDYRSYLVRLSDELGTCIVGGTVVQPDGDRIYNTCFVIDRGNMVGQYRKRFPVPGEIARGITPGERRFVVSIDGIRIATLICGDVFHPELYAELAGDDVDVVFIPTTSPYRPEDSLSQKQERDQKYFVAGAEAAGAYVVKTCGAGSIFGHRLQGRSLIAAPWGVVNRVEPRDEDSVRILTETLDIAELRDFRRRYRESNTPPSTSPQMKQGSL